MDIREKIVELFIIARQEGVIPRYADGKADTDELLSLETDTERIAIVLKEPVLPLPVYLKGSTSNDPYILGQNRAQQDMIDPKKGRFVQEVKEGE